MASPNLIPSPNLPAPTNQALSSFSQQFENLLRSSMTNYKEELDKREKILHEKEAKLNLYFNYDKLNEKLITVHVGTTTFKTTSAILCSVPDSYFSYKLVDPEVTELFVPRDPCSFALVLEYLTYGRVCSLPISDGLQFKLLQDAKAFFLPELVQWCEQYQPISEEKESLRLHIESRLEQFEKTITASPKLCFIRLGTGILSGNSWSWAVEVNTHPDLFALTTSTAANDSVVLREPGVYRIVAKVTASSPANYYASLVINEEEISRSYASSCGYYFHSFYFYEIQELKAGTRLKITQTGHNSAMTGNQAHSWMIEKISDRIVAQIV